MVIQKKNEKHKIPYCRNSSNI